MSCRKQASYKLIMATLLLSLLNRLLYGAAEAMSFIGLDASCLVGGGGGGGRGGGGVLGRRESFFLS